MNEQKTQIILFITFETEIGMRLIYIFVNKRKSDMVLFGICTRIVLLWVTSPFE